MKEKILYKDIISHASNLGALIADNIAAPLGIPALIYDSVAADEMYDIAHITGVSDIIRQPYSHVLNTKAMARKYAKTIGKHYEDMNFLVAHIGGGVSVNAHEKGRIVDSIEDDGGPFSIERSGSIPLSYIIDMAYSNKYSKKELVGKLRGMGGLKSHLGTHDCREVERRIMDGDDHAATVYKALAYQIAKGIGEMAPVLKGNIDAIILTGGVAYSEMLTGWIKEYIKFIAPVHILPGENEMEALAFGALRILNNEESLKEYGG
jgi:butyrate kinase